VDEFSPYENLADEVFDRIDRCSVGLDCSVDDITRIEQV